MAFSDIGKKEKFDVIDIAIVNDDEFEENLIFKNAFEELSDEKDEDRLFNTKYVSLEEAKELLQNEKVVGYLKLEEGEPKLIFEKNSQSNLVVFLLTDAADNDK